MSLIIHHSYIQYPMNSTPAAGRASGSLPEAGFRMTSHLFLLTFGLTAVRSLLTSCLFWCKNALFLQSDRPSEESCSFGRRANHSWNTSCFWQEAKPPEPNATCRTQIHPVLNTDLTGSVSVVSSKARIEGQETRLGWLVFCDKQWWI